LTASGVNDFGFLNIYVAH